MQNEIWGAALTTFLLASPPAISQVLHCAGLNPTEPGDATRAYACVSKLSADLEEASASLIELTAKVEQLEATQPVPSIGKHEKTRAVVAFYADKGQQACPDEWSLYVEAKDRMIVGAGALYQYPGETGGELEVTLTIAQMPKHSHRGHNIRAGVGQGNTNNLHPWLTSARDQLVEAVEKTGENQPHNNMPPYIALYFCKKD